jgi:hypothetical protein
MDVQEHAHILDLGRRIELVSMDPWCYDITVALYRRLGQHAIIHSYSAKPGVPERLSWLAETMGTIAGLEHRRADRTVWFSCTGWHERGLRRALLEACKLDPSRPVVPRPMALDDPRSDERLEVGSIGHGAYQVRSSAGEATNRVPAVAAGLAKLLDLEADPADQTVVRFACGMDHDRLIGLLFLPAINVRATLRAEEAATTRGFLVAPSAQEVPA